MGASLHPERCSLIDDREVGRPLARWKMREDTVMRPAQTGNATKLICRRGITLHQWMRAAALLSALVFASRGVADPAGNSRAYTLAPGDRITVTVFGQPELSGEILVDGTGSIVLPFIGPFDIGGLTIAECQKLIHDRLADSILNQPSVSVRLSELRPLYILGEVRTPGAYPFRYGSTVKSAVASAGGFRPPDPMQIAAVSEFLLADERVRQLTFRKRALLVRLARLEAQRDGMRTFSPPTPQDTMGGDNNPDIVASEMEIFEAQAAILNEQIDLLRSQKPRIQNEVDALNAQIATAKKQGEIVKQHADQYGRLIKQGLGVTNTELQYKLAEASHESELWRLTAHVSRLQMDTGEIDLKLHEAAATFKRQLITELRDVRERLRELDIILPLAREVRDVKLRQAGTLADDSTTYSISVTRTRDGETAEFQASETAFLQPGDIVDVKRPVSHTVATINRLGLAASRDGYSTERDRTATPVGSVLP
jgi:polysaccharide export outer membrane protein